MRPGATLLSAIALVALTATPASAGFFDELKKDWNKVTGEIKGAIDDVTEGKEDVEGMGKDAESLQQDVTGALGDEPRYDAPWVTEIQQRLAALGLDPGPLDGSFGRKTTNAIATFQKIAALNPDGLPRPSVMRVLRAKTQAAQTTQQSASPNAEANAADGSGSGAVDALQSGQSTAESTATVETSGPAGSGNVWDILPAPDAAAQSAVKSSDPLSGGGTAEGLVICAAHDVWPLSAKTAMPLFVVKDPVADEELRGLLARLGLDKEIYPSPIPANEVSSLLERRIGPVAFHDSGVVRRSEAMEAGVLAAKLNETGAAKYCRLAVASAAASAPDSSAGPATNAGGQSASAPPAVDDTGPLAVLRNGILTQ